MIASNEEPSQIIILNEFLVYLSVLVFHVYRYIWQPKIKGILETHIGPEEKSAVAVIDKEGCIIEHLPKAWTCKGTGGKYAKTIFFFLRSDGLNICLLEVTGKVVNTGDEKGRKVTSKLNFKGNPRIIDIIKNIIC